MEDAQLSGSGSRIALDESAAHPVKFESGPVSFTKSSGMPQRKTLVWFSTASVSVNSNLMLFSSSDVCNTTEEFDRNREKNWSAPLVYVRSDLNVICTPFDAILTTMCPYRRLT